MKSDAKQPSNRRNLLKALASGGVVAGTALPAAWTRPVVDSVLLPAHAQTTTTADFFGTGIVQITARDSVESGLIAGLLDDIVAPAEAGNPSALPIQLELAVNQNGGDDIDVVFKFTDVRFCDEGQTTTGEFSALYAASTTFNRATTIEGLACDGFAADGKEALQLRVNRVSDDLLQALGSLFGSPFDFFLTPGGIVPTPSPCIECPEER